MAKKSLLPNDFRDFLSLASFIGLFGTFLLFVFGNSLISQNIDALFLIISGAGLMVAGNVFQIKKWLSDGLQKNEVTMILSVVIGLSASVIGMLLLVGVSLPQSVTSVGGWVALFSSVFIAFDYLSKNTGMF